MIGLLQTEISSPLVIGGVPWFPQGYARQFFVVQGALAMSSTLLLMYHMHMIWSHLMKHSNIAQRARYLTLLAMSVLITGASIEAAHDGAFVNYRNIGSLIVTLMLVVTMIISIRSDKHQYYVQSYSRSAV